MNCNVSKVTFHNVDIENSCARVIIFCRTFERGRVARLVTRGLGLLGTGKVYIMYFFCFFNFPRGVFLSPRAYWRSQLSLYTLEKENFHQKNMLLTAYRKAFPYMSFLLPAQRKDPKGKGHGNKCFRGPDPHLPLGQCRLSTGLR